MTERWATAPGVRIWSWKSSAKIRGPSSAVLRLDSREYSEERDPHASFHRHSRAGVRARIRIRAETRLREHLRDGRQEHDELARPGRGADTQLRDRTLVLK